MKKICTLFLTLTVLVLTVLAFSSCEKGTEGLVYYEYGDGYSVGIENGKYLNEIVIPKKHEGKPVVAIAKKGFLGCENLLSITIPDSVTVIEDSAFQNCYRLESITIPSGVTSIGRQAFKGCKALNNVVIPNNVTSLGELIFSNCKALTTITISDSVLAIGNNAFEGCTGLREINIPKGVSTIGTAIFQGCTALKTITVDENNESFKVIAAGLYSKDGMILYQYAIGAKADSYDGPEGLTTILPNAFDGCKTINLLILPSTVTSVGKKAFNECPITTAKVPTAAIGEIDKTSLQVVEINGGEEIERNAFKAAPMLKKVTISGDVKIIGDSAFYNCASIRSVELNEGTEIIDEYAFKGCTYLNSINLPDTLKEIGANAFKDCGRITKIIIPADVEEIGMFAFEGCNGLEGIYCRGPGRPKGWNEWWKVKDGNTDHEVMWRYEGD